MNPNYRSKKLNSTPGRRFWIGGILLALGIGGWIGVERAMDNDEMTRLRRYTPHGSHFIATALTGGAVTLRSREIGLWKVRKKTREFPSVPEFQEAFQRISPHPEASISVHHPPLNLTVEEGRNSHDRAEEILTFLAESGYKHAGPISN